MVTLTQLAESTEPVQLQVSATSEGLAYDPTGDPVQIAFVPVPSPPASPDPTDAEWNTAYWETDPGPAYWAGILVGPLNGGVQLEAGAYVAFVKVIDNPAVPVKPGCYLNVT
jgi:hypothetical protein